jgi:hypothetical protein
VIIVLAAATVLALAALAFIAVPLVRPPAEAPQAEHLSTELIARRDRIYTELRELEFDARVGKVTGNDYVDARDRLEAEAARVLRAIDGELKARDVAAHQFPPNLKDESPCQACGANLSPDARFCPACGAVIGAVVAR